MPGKSLRKMVEEALGRKVSLGLDLIGDIAILRLPQVSREEEAKIAEIVMRVHRNVKAVFKQVSPVSGEFRLRRLEHLAGEKRLETVHREYGCLFKVNVAEAYFSPRLHHERFRVARLVSQGEVVVNFFAGVGCFSIMAAKHGKPSKVYSIDLNPAAYRYMKENILLNRVVGIVEPMLGDAAKLAEEKLERVANRVLLPLPELAQHYLPYAAKCLKARGGWIHYYDFVEARKPREALKEALKLIPEQVEGFKLQTVYGRIVRSVGPGRWQIVLDVKAEPLKPV